ncbi:inositol 5-phosphatase [Schistosoma japonicum]|nr:inositol 5-phosphatase [Schistosoma japonicum]
MINSIDTDSSSNESSFDESTLTSRTYTLLSENKSSTHQCCCHSCKLKSTIVYNSTSNYLSNHFNRLHHHSSRSTSNMHSITSPHIDHSIQSLNENTNNNCTNYQIQLKNTNTNKQYTTNKKLLTKFNTLTNSSNIKSINDNLKYYSSVRSQLNAFNVEYIQQNTQNELHKRPLLSNMTTNQMNSVQCNNVINSKPISNNERYLSTRSLSSGLRIQKSIEQTTEIDLYKTAMFVIPAPTSNSLPNIQNDNSLEQLNHCHHHHHHHHQQHHDRQHHHHHHQRQHRQHHRHKETSDSCIHTKCHNNIRTYICKGCGRTTLRRKKFKNSSHSFDYSCLSLDKCSTPHFINSLDNHNIHCHNQYERILFQSPGDYLEDNQYSTLSTHKSYTYPNHTTYYPNDNYCNKQNELCNNLSESNKLPLQLDCNKIIVDIKPRQLNEADKQHHITQWIKLGTLGDTPSSPTISPLPPDEYQDKDCIIHPTRFSNDDDDDDDEDDNDDDDDDDDIEDLNITTTNNKEHKDHSRWINSHEQQVKHIDTSDEQHIEYQNVNKEIKKIQIIKQQESPDTNSLIISRSDSNYTNNTKNDRKYEFMNNSNHYNPSNDNSTTNNEISSTKNRIIKKPLNIDTNSQYNVPIKETSSSFETINEVSPSIVTSIDDNTTSSNHNVVHERIITIKDIGKLNKQRNFLSIDRHSPTLSLHMDSDIASCSTSSMKTAPIIAPKPKFINTTNNRMDEIYTDKKKTMISTMTTTTATTTTSTMITSEIRAMNSKISSNLSNKTIVNNHNILFNTELIHHNELLKHSTECTTDLYPNLVKTRDTPIPNVKNLVTYFTELIRLHTNVKDVNHSYTINNNINRLKDYDYDVTDNLHNVLHNLNNNNNNTNVDDYELDIPANISPFLLHHETPTARERRLQAVEMLRRRSTVHMKYDPCRVFPPGYDNSTSLSLLDRVNHNLNNDNNDKNNNSNNLYESDNENIYRIKMKHTTDDPIRRPLSAPKYQVRMQANLQKDSTPITAQ